MGNGTDTAAPGASWVRRRAALLATAVCVTALLPTTGAAAATPAPAEAAGRYLVTAPTGGLQGLLADLQAQGVSVERTLGIIDTAVVDVRPSDVPGLRALPSVLAITADAPLTPAASSYDPVTDAGSAYNVAAAVGAPAAWADGHTGEGIDVALIDTGVAPVGPLATPGTVVNGPDLSFDSQSKSTRYLDANGHGTFMAGLIAGRATSSARGAYQGMAPDARIVNVKVGDALGRVDVSQVIAAIDWVVQHAQDPGFNIRVLNLSFGTDSKQGYEIDPLAHAAEVAWRHGIVVVASAGNKGTSQLEMPAADPYVLAVGAWDSRGTLSPYDDKVASFSATGTAARGLDVLAPGVRIQGLRVPGSYVDSSSAAPAGSARRTCGERDVRGGRHHLGRCRRPAEREAAADARPGEEPARSRRVAVRAAMEHDRAHARPRPGHRRLEAVLEAVGRTRVGHRVARGLARWCPRDGRQRRPGG